MANQKSYSEKLKDPKWQKKRLEIFQRDGFRCARCFNDTSMLAVHHKVYIKGNEPWDYDNDLLVTLCEECHSDIKEILPVAVQNLTRALSQMDYHYTDLQLITKAIINAGSMLTGRGILDTLIDANILTMDDISEHTHPTLQKIIGLK